MSIVRLAKEQYAGMSHCVCGHKPVLVKEYRSYGIITGTKYNYFVHCQHCKRTGAKFYHYKTENAISRAIRCWNHSMEGKPKIDRTVK